MSEDQIKRIEVTLAELRSMLQERCENRHHAIKKNAEDIDKAFKDIRALKESVHHQNIILAKWSSISSVLSAVLTGIVMKVIVG